MGRLKQLKGLLAPLQARIGYVDDLEVNGKSTRNRAHHWRRWYKTAQWQRLRWSVLERDLFTCRLCGLVEGNTALLVADHVVPHRGDEALFWSEGNLQCLCKACHDSAKQSEEQAGRQRGR